MKDILKEIDRLLFQIKVSGDDVVLMAQARTLLKKAYEIMTENNKEERSAHETEVQKAAD